MTGTGQSQSANERPVFLILTNDRWRMEDGLLCRSDQDCMWLDERLRCTDYKMDWSVARDWFNGDTASIVGSCDCLEGFTYEEDQISCIVSDHIKRSHQSVYNSKYYSRRTRA